MSTERVFIRYFRLKYHSNHTQQILRSIFFLSIFVLFESAEIILCLDIERLDLSPLNILAIFATDIEYFDDILR